ncbi:Fic family protein [Candidatus Pacearchaeota archaeon]|nr:Fic family protein [Candidatus Pacearchaeota archaeon]
MPYTEIKEKNGKKYYYRVKSIRRGDKISKKRVYLGVDLDKTQIYKKELEADKELVYLNNLLTHEELKELERIKQEYLKQPKENISNRYEVFTSDFTYNSTAIEGNTLTLQETAQLLFEGITPRKSLREINEVINHKLAFDYLLEYKGDITKDFICNLHKLVVENTLKEELKSQIGCFRNIQVYIRGTNWLPPKPEEVSKEIKSLLFWYSSNKRKLHPLILSAYFHAGFETIHPFVDGNGRVGRLLMNFILHKNKYPMINIPNTIKHKYYSALESSQVKGDLKPLIKLLFEILKNSKVRF